MATAIHCTHWSPCREGAPQIEDLWCPSYGLPFPYKIHNDAVLHLGETMVGGLHINADDPIYVC